MAGKGGRYQQLMKQLIEGELDGDFRQTGDFSVTMLHDGNVLNLHFYYANKKIASYVLTGLVGREGTTGRINRELPK